MVMYERGHRFARERRRRCLLEVKNLTKQYGDHIAVSDLSFTVEDGRIYGFLGPNGAGKSTTMNIITGCLAASDGHVIINGHDIFDEPMEAKRCIGYLPELPPLYVDMTPEEYLHFVAEAKGVKKEEIDADVEAAMGRTGILNMRKRLIKHLSKGYRQRVGLAEAILGSPEIIILDEPTVGLDPKQIIEIRELIKELGRDHTVILSSHILSEVAAVCDEVMIISHGKMVAVDAPENLSRHLRSTSTLKLTVRADRQKAEQALAPLGALGAVSFAEDEEGLTHITVEETAERDMRDEIFYAMADARCPIIEMTLAVASLEDVFLELTQEDGADNKEKNREEGDDGEGDLQA